MFTLQEDDIQVASVRMRQIVRVIFDEEQGTSFFEIGVAMVFGEFVERRFENFSEGETLFRNIQVYKIVRIHNHPHICGIFLPENCKIIAS